MLGNLSPVSHYTTPNIYRVPLYREKDGNFIVYVADNFVRNFTNETLPDEIKTKLGLILGASSLDVRDWEFFNADVYVPKHMVEGFDEIGWQVSDNYFCICMSTELLNELRGDDDPRRKSKR